MTKKLLPSKNSPIWTIANVILIALFLIGVGLIIFGLDCGNQKQTNASAPPKFNKIITCSEGSSKTYNACMSEQWSVSGNSQTDGCKKAVEEEHCIVSPLPNPAYVKWQKQGTLQYGNTSNSEEKS